MSLQLSKYVLTHTHTHTGDVMNGCLHGHQESVLDAARMLSAAIRRHYIQLQQHR